MARNLLAAFRKAKEACYKGILGPDPWPYNLKDNGKTLETFTRYHHEQGMIPSPFGVEELLISSTLDVSSRYV